MPELMLAITAARREGFTVSLYFSSIGNVETCSVSVLTPCRHRYDGSAHLNYKCEHLCALLTCTVEEAAILIARLTDFPC